MTFDVTLLRDLLMEIGQKQYNTITDEMAIVASNDKIYLLFARVEDVIGVWAIDDTAKANNLYTGGSLTNKQIITLGTPTAAGTYITASYVMYDGLNDNTAQEMIDQTKHQVIVEIGDETIDLDNPTTSIEHLARSYWMMQCLYSVYLVMNNVNFIQGDANLSLFNYQYSSKLWGEGMSTDALFQRLDNKLKELRKDLFIAVDSTTIYTSEGSPQSYWTDDTMLKGWLSATYQNSTDESLLESSIRSDQ